MVWEDFARGGALIVSEDVIEALGDINTAPLGRRPKNDDEGFPTNDGRVIFDGSAGGPRCRRR